MTGGDFVTLEASDEAAEQLPTLAAKYSLGRRYLYAAPGGDLLFTNNETNASRVYGSSAQSRTPYQKDAFHRHIINGEACLSPSGSGTKACIHYADQIIPAGGSLVVRLRLSDKVLDKPLADVDQIVTQRRLEADEFYESIHPPWRQRKRSKSKDKHCRSDLNKQSISSTFMFGLTATIRSGLRTESLPVTVGGCT